MQDLAKLNMSNGNKILVLTKGVFWAVSLSLLSVLIFAVVIKYTTINEGAIQPINQVIKVLSILIGCWVVGKKLESNGWLWGMIIGVAYTVLAFVIFSILDGTFNLSLNLFNDIIFGAVLGIIAGIICISFRK